MQFHFTVDVEIWDDPCAKPLQVWPTLRHAAPVRGDPPLGRYFGWAGALLERHGVKATLRRLIRGHG